MSIIRKNNGPSRFSTFREEKKSFVHNENKKEKTHFSRPTKFQQQSEGLQSPYDQAVPPARKLQVKFFPFLNEFSRKLSHIKEYNLQNADIDSDNHGSIEFTENVDDNSIIKKSSSENGEQSQKRRRQSRNKSSRDSIQIIEANLQNGKFHGFAKLILKNGGVFTGQTDNGQLKQGQVCFQSGLQYQGAFENNVFHGDSQIRLANGTKIKMKWFQGMPEPKGEIFYTNGQYYVGGMKNFKKDGLGQLKLKNGKKYVGQFEKGEICGKGTFYDEDGKMIAQGMWYNGKYLGSSVQTPSSKSDQLSESS